MTPLPLRAVAMAVRDGGRSGGWQRDLRDRCPVGEGGHVLGAEGTFQRWWLSCLCVWDIDFFMLCVVCGDTWVLPC